MDGVRASRLVSIVLLLQARERLTARQLADELAVSVRTVYRDMDALSASGVPVFAESGHDGGYRLVDGYRTRLTGLTSAEAESLFLPAADDLGLGPAAAAARLKLLAAVPDPFRDRAARTAARFHLDAPAWYRAAEPTPQLGVVADAVWSQRPLRLRYLRWARPHEVTRRVLPYGLVLKGGRWYLVAASDGEFRTYRVSRILDAEQEDAGFDRDERFDLVEHWQAYQRDFDRRRLREQAHLRVSPPTYAELSELLEPAAVAAAEQSAELDPDGWHRVSIPVESVERAVPELLRLGAGVEVLGPPELRGAMLETLLTLTGRYQT